MDWMFYIMSACAAIAVSNVVDKVLVDKYIKNSSVIVLFTGFVALITGIIIFIFRGFPLFPLNQIIIVLTAGILLEFYLIPYFIALEIDDPSRVIPYFQLVPVITIALSFVFLGESLLPRQYIGALCIVISAFVLSLNKNTKIMTVSPSFRHMLLASFLLSCSMVLFKFVVSIQHTWDSIAYESLGMGLGALLIASRGTYMKEFLDYSKRVSVVGWISLGISESFYILYRFLLSFALALGPAGLVSVLSGFQPVFVFLYGIFFTLFLPSVLKENITPRLLWKKVSIFGIIFFGLYLIYI